MTQSKVAERLLVHARLCRRLAASSLDENVAYRLLQMADECAQAAADNSAGDNVKAGGLR